MTYQPEVRCIKMRLAEPDSQQQEQLAQYFGCARKVYNALLANNKEAYIAYKKDKQQNLKPKVSAFDLVKQLTVLKANPDFIYLNEVSSVALQQSVIDLGRSYQNCFKNPKHFGSPSFKKRSNRQSIRLTTDAFKILDNKLKIQKISKPFTIRLSCKLPSKPTSLTVIKEPNGNYYASFVIRREPKLTNGQNIIGIDVGIKTLLYCSTGQTIANPRFLASGAKRIKKLQQAVSRRRKPRVSGQRVPQSQNYHRAVKLLAITHSKIATKRNNLAHQVSRSLVNDSQVIVLEDLKLPNMLRNHSLAKALGDAALGRIRQYICYKAEESHHCNVLLAGQYFASTQICHHCRQQSPTKIELHMRDWTCPNCQTYHDRDGNAAMNLEQLATDHLDLFSQIAGRIVEASDYKMALKHKAVGLPSPWSKDGMSDTTIFGVRDHLTQEYELMAVRTLGVDAADLLPKPFQHH